MKIKDNIIIGFLSLFSLISNSSCNKKDYYAYVQYKVTVTPVVGQNLITNIEYLIKDNVLKKEIITSAQWEYNFKGAHDDNVYLKVINSSNAPFVKIEMITNGRIYSEECNMNGCSVEVKGNL